MWHPLFSLIFLLFLTGLYSPVQAEDWITGRIVSIDSVRQELELIPEDRTSISVRYDPETSPSQMTPGDFIRVQGVFSGTDFRTFTATHIGKGMGQETGLESPSGHDPTGVRSRIGRGRGMGRGSHEGRGSHRSGGRR